MKAVVKDCLVGRVKMKQIRLTELACFTVPGVEVRMELTKSEIEYLWKKLREEVCEHKNKKPSNQFDLELGFMDCADCGKDLG